MYCIYFDLLKTVRRDDLDESVRLLRELDTRLDVGLPSFYSRWGALPELTAARYLDYVNIDPTTPVTFKTLSGTRFTRSAGMQTTHSLYLIVLSLRLQRRSARC